VSTSSQLQSASAVHAAIICAGAVGAQFVGGKAARDALFLAQVDVTSLPAMVVATSIFSIALVAVNAKGVSRLSPARFVPWAFAASAILLIAEWALTFTSPKLAAVLVYLHISGVGPILGSGFWLVATERFDPRTAKRKFGQIAAGGTFGGLLGGLLAERVAVMFGVGPMLPVLAVLNLVCAWQVRRIVPAPTSQPRSEEFSAELTPEPAWSGVRVLAETPYLRHLALLVLLGSTSAALIDYAFKAQAVAMLGTGEGLLRFFGAYYAIVSLATFAVQTSTSRLALERFGLAFTTATPSIALFAGSLGNLAVPGFAGAIIARGSESVFRGSLFRSGYEVFYTPIPSAEKRAAKSIIDVGFDRIGDAVGGIAVRNILLLAPHLQYSAIMLLTLLGSAATVAVASRLNRGYVQTLERNLRGRAVELDLSTVQDLTTRTTMLKTLPGLREGTGRRLKAAGAPETFPPPAPASRTDSAIQDIHSLRSRDGDRVFGVLRRDAELTSPLILHVIPLMAWDLVAADAIRALQKVAPKHVGALSDALLDPYEDFAVRRRVPRVMAVCGTQRAADSLVLGLADTRFEVRFQCGRALAAITAKHPQVRVDPAAVFEVVEKEVAVGRPVWEGRRLLDRLDDSETDRFVDEFIRSRANQSLAHVFTMLSLALPREPLQIALRGLHAGDAHLRGTALEYLESILPAAIRGSLWPFLEDHRPPARTVRPREDILADLVRSNQSIMLNLEELKRRG
jgi:AAA family ATP:ADP antiporter